MTNRTFDGALGPDQADFEVGDDADMPGLAAPLTLDDIDAIVHSARYSVDQKRRMLNDMRDRLDARMSMDASGEFDPLRDRIAEGLSTLSEIDEAKETGAPESFGFDPESRGS